MARDSAVRHGRHGTAWQHSRALHRTARQDSKVQSGQCSISRPRIRNTKSSCFDISSRPWGTKSSLVPLEMSICRLLLFCLTLGFQKEVHQFLLKLGGAASRALPECPPARGPRRACRRQYSILCYAILYYTILYYTILCFTTLHYITLITLHYTILYCTILYYTPHHTTPHHTRRACQTPGAATSSGCSWAPGRRDALRGG